MPPKRNIEKLLQDIYVKVLVAVSDATDDTDAANQPAPVARDKAMRDQLWNDLDNELDRCLKTAEERAKAKPKPVVTKETVREMEKRLEAARNECRTLLDSIVREDPTAVDGIDRKRLHQMIVNLPRRAAGRKG